MSNGRIARGVPSVTYCRVVSSTQLADQQHQGDVLSDGNSITILEPGQPSTRHEVAQILERGISEEEACECTIGSRAGAGLGASLNPIAACVNDAATAVVFLVGSRETRKWQFLKRTMLPFVANELFANIAEKDQQLASHYYRAQINLSAFEIQEEIITDLLRPVNRGLPLTVTAEDGVIVSGLHSETIIDEMDLRRLLLDGCDNRATHTLPPGGSIDTSTAVFEFTIFQSEGENALSAANGTTCETRSRLLVIDVPSTDPLAMGGAVDIRQLEGPLLHKSLLAFVDVIKKLNTPSRAAVAPFRSSKLTHYLSELLGGNAVVVAIGQLANGEQIISRKTLELLGALNNAVHYPIGGKELTDVLQGLLGKYRSMLMQLQDELVHRDTDSLGAKESEMNLERQVLELQKDAAKSRLDCSTAEEDRERMYEMAELLRAKYGTVMQEKAAQSEELAQCKEDNVTLAKTLIDKNEELAAFKAEMEKKSFESDAQLLACKSSIEDLQNEKDSLNANIETLNTAIDERDHKTDVLRLEIDSLNNQLAEKEKEMKIERDKNLELAAELLTLVNRRDLLQQQNDELQDSSRSLQAQLKELQQREGEVMQQLQAVQQELRRKEEEVFETARRCAAIELEAKETKLAADKLVIECRERMLEKGTTLETARNTPKYEELQSTVKKGSKVIKELERNLRRTQADLIETEKEKEDIERHLQEVREKYRKKLAAALMHEGGSTSEAYHHNHAKVHHRRISKRGAQRDTNEEDGHQTPRSAAASSVTSIATTEKASSAAQMQHQLIDSYEERERMLRKDLASSLQQRGAIKLAYRELFDKYSATLDFIEDNLPKSAASRMKPLMEQLTFMENDLKTNEAYLEELEKAERSAARNQIEAEEKSRIAEVERMSLIVATYMRNLEDTEKKLAAAQQESIDLHVQINQLIENAKASKPSEEAPVQHAVPDGNAFKEFAKMLAHKSDIDQSAVHGVQTAKEYADVVAQLSKEIVELKSQLNTFNAGGIEAAPKLLSPTPPPCDTSLLRPDSGKKLIPASDQFTVDSFENPHNFRSIQECLQYISSLEANANAALTTQLQYAQKRTTELAMRNTALEEELRSYQNYMRDVIPQYKRQLLILKQQLGNSKNDGDKRSTPTRNSTSNADDVNIKFPPID